MISAYISFKPLHSSYKWANVNVPLLVLDWNLETAHQFQFQSFLCGQLMVLDFDKDLTVTHHLRILTATATMTALSYFNKDTPSALLLMTREVKVDQFSLLQTIFSAVGSCFKNISI